MSWVTLSIANIQQKLSAAELAAVNSAVLADGQASPVTEVIAGVTAELRGRLRNKTKLETGATIPDAWVPSAISVIRYRLCTRLPSKVLMTPAREKEYDDALRAFQQLGPIMPEVPVLPDNEQTGGSIPQMNVRHSRMSSRDQDGL
jgi:hypothetical protein